MSSSSATVPEFEDDRQAVQSIFSSTPCYALMATSAKVIVFETAIPFQLAFQALVEHETDIAPLRDAQSRSLVAMMTPYDFTVALQICRQHNIPVSELTTKTIAEMLSSPILRFRHSELRSIEAEDSAFQLYMLLQGTGAEFVPVLDPETGHLVAVLGYFQMLYLLHEACKQHSRYFFQTIEKVGVFDNFVTAPISTKLEVVLLALEERNLTAIPVTDLEGKVVGMYHRADVNFMTRSVDPGVALRNLTEMTVGDAMQLQLLPPPPPPAVTPGAPPVPPGVDPIPLPREFNTVRVSPRDNVMKVVGLLVAAHSLIAVVVNDVGMCVGTISVMDILRYYFSSESGFSGATEASAESAMRMDM